MAASSHESRSWVGYQRAWAGSESETRTTRAEQSSTLPDSRRQRLRASLSRAARPGVRDVGVEQDRLDAQRAELRQTIEVVHDISHPIERDPPGR
jgi:hypothetical protein